MNLEMRIALELVKEAEGFEPHEYRCTAKKLTQGYGRNLEVHPLSDEEKAELNEDGSVSKEVAENYENGQANYEMLEKAFEGCK